MKRILLSLIFVAVFTSVSTAQETHNALQVTSQNVNYLTTADGGECCDLQKTEVLGNTHIAPGTLPITITNEYNSVVYTDHSYQDVILEYFLEGDELKRYTITDTLLFTKKTTRSASKSVRDMDKTCDVVYAFRDKAHLNLHIRDGMVVGYIDTFVGKKDNETLMDAFDQAIIDTGEFGGNVLLVLKYDFMIGNSSTTIGLGGSASTGFLGGSKQSSSYNTAIGYASNVTLPKTFSFIHGIAIYSPSIAAMEAWRGTK